MMSFNNLICEYPLPVPFDKFCEETKEDLKDVKWNELVFFTPSIVEEWANNVNGFLNYTISEDGQLYRCITIRETVLNEDGEGVEKERNEGLERVNTTGEIAFGVSLLKENFDYSVYFNALFFKGDLKELSLNRWEKMENKKRKDLTKKYIELLRQDIQKKKRLFYKVFSFFRNGLSLAIGFIRWILSKVFYWLGEVQEIIMRR